MDPRSHAIAHRHHRRCRHTSIPSLTVGANAYADTLCHVFCTAGDDERVGVLCWIGWWKEPCECAGLDELEEGASASHGVWLIEAHSCMARAVSSGFGYGRRSTQVDADDVECKPADENSYGQRAT